MEQLLGWPSQPEVASSRREVIVWWESRRLRFNLYVGAVGAASWILTLVAGSAAVKPGLDFAEPIALFIGPLVYGFLANICYTLGWVADTILYRGTPSTRLYRAGVITSVFLTAVPGVWAVVAWLLTLVTGQKLA